MHISARSVAAVLAATGSLTAGGAAAQAQGGPPLPTAANGNTVTAVGHGVPTPTAFAFGGGTVFAASGPDENTGGPGGLFVVANGTATKVPGAPPVIFGLAWRHGKLYVAAGKDLIVLRGWNGTRFAKSKTIYAGSKRFPGFNGLAFGPHGRLYAGLSLNEKYDHRKDPFRLSQAVVSMRPNGKHLRIVARGLRQPFQLTFPKGSRHPFVSVLSQDKGRIPPDQIVVAKPHQNYGFPTCTWLRKKACRGFAKPRILLPKHASPMGIGSVGRRLYVSLFGGLGTGPEVVTIPARGGKPKPVLTGFVAPVIALGIHRGALYTGDLTGTIYRVAL